MKGIASVLVLGWLAIVGSSLQAAPTVADGVVGYADGNATLKDPNSALGGLDGLTTWGAVNPFNPPFAASDIVVVGTGGQLTLHLSKPVPTNGRNLGVYVNDGYFDISMDGSGLTDGGPSLFSAAPQAVVSVSRDGFLWQTLNGGAPISFSVATNYYLDTSITFYNQPEGNVAARQSKPYLGSPSDLGNKPYEQIRTAFNGSRGGNWLDLSGKGLPTVNYVRFDVPSGTGRMVVDAVGALGAAAPVIPGGRIISESVGAGASTSHIVVDFGPQSYQFDVHYDGNFSGLQALEAIAANSDFQLATELYGLGRMVTRLDYGGYVQTGDGSNGDDWWRYYAGDGNAWSPMGLGASRRLLTNGSYDGWVWQGAQTAVPDLPIAAGTAWTAASGPWSDGNAWTAGEPNAGTFAYVGSGGVADLSQDGRACAALTVGWSAGQPGSVRMTGGSLVCGQVLIGCGGDGNFAQSGGMHTILGRLVVGASADANGAYVLLGGELIVPAISIGKTGALVLAGGVLRGSDSDANLRTGVSNSGLLDVAGTGGVALLEYVKDEAATLTGEVRVEANAVLGLRKLVQRKLTVAGVLRIDGPSKTISVLNSLSIAGGTDAWTGTVDIGRNALVVSCGPFGDANVVYQQLVNQARFASDNLVWDRPGLTSTAAQADTRHLTTVAVVLNRDDSSPGSPAFLSNFDATPDANLAVAVDTRSVLVKYTYYGDADLNGIVDERDLDRFSTGYSDQRSASPKGLTGWAWGDFDNNGSIDERDLDLFSTAYSMHGGPLGPANVPEPATLTMFLGAMVCGALRRRPRRQK